MVLVAGSVRGTSVLADHYHDRSDLWHEGHVRQDKAEAEGQMIAINGDKIVSIDTEYGVYDAETDTVVEHGDDLAAASTDSLIFGGAIQIRKVYLGTWTTSDAERDIAPDDVMPHGD